MPRFFIAYSLMVGCTIQSSVFIDGFIPRVTIDSSALNAPADAYTPADLQRYFQIYLPQGFDKNSDNNHYPVIYFLHGFGHNHMSYTIFIRIIETLITTGQLPPVVVVKPDASSKGYLGNFYNDLMQHYLVEELIPYVSEKYHLKKTHLILMGHGMGGFGALQCAARYPRLFTAVSCCLTPFSLFTSLNSIRSHLIAELPQKGPLTGMLLPCNGPASAHFYAMAHAIGLKASDIFEKPADYEALWNTHYATLSHTHAFMQQPAKSFSSSSAASFFIPLSLLIPALKASAPAPLLPHLCLLSIGIAPDKYKNHNANLIRLAQHHDIQEESIIEDIPTATHRLMIDPARFGIENDADDEWMKEALYALPLFLPCRKHPFCYIYN